MSNARAVNDPHAGLAAPEPPKKKARGADVAAFSDLIAAPVDAAGIEQVAPECVEYDERGNKLDVPIPLAAAEALSVGKAHVGRPHEVTVEIETQTLGR